MDEIQRQRSLERRLLIVRWLGVAFAAFQVWTFYLPYPSGMLRWAIAAVVLFALATIATTPAVLRARDERSLRLVGLAGMTVDAMAVFSLVLVFTFDVNTAMFATLYLLPVEAAMRYGLRGALAMMAIATLFYTAREVWGSQHYGYDFLPASISFRMGIGFIIALSAGSMADAWRREHRRVDEQLAQERKTADALRRLDEVKTTFLRAVSHELRTPLTSIMGFAITLQDRADELTPENRVMLEHIAEQAEDLNELLVDLLDMNELLRGAPELSLELVELGDLVSAVASRVASRGGRRVELDVKPMQAQVDRSKVERVVESLVQNAVKFAPGDEEILVSTRSADGGLVISVEDRGPGVPPELREAIFEPFRQAPAGADHDPGTGIGLSLVDRFARLHGGNAWVEDRPGGGASFRVFLPQDEVAATPDPAKR
jgi:signal transduction histidine kinase